MDYLLEDKKRERMTVDYVAQHLFYVTKAQLRIAGFDYDGESYLELMYPKKIKKDERSAEQIKQDLLKRLSE